MNPSLSELQNWMLWAITDPRGASVALEDPNREDLGARYCAPQPCACQSIAENPTASRGRRLDIYAEAYFARLAETLGDDFSSVKVVLGENLFLKLVADYLKVHPSRATNINEAGRHLSTFCKGWLTDSPELETAYPFLSDLCELEWRQIEAFYATENEPIQPETLADRSDEDWSNARFDFAHGVAIIRSNWDLLTLQRRPEESEVHSATALLIARVKGEVESLRLASIESQILLRLFEGSSLDEALRDESEETAGELSEWFGKWMSLGIFRAIRFPSTSI